MFLNLLAKNKTTLFKSDFILINSLKKQLDKQQCKSTLVQIIIVS